MKEKCLNYEYCGNNADFNDTFCLQCYKAHDLGFNIGYNQAITDNLLEEITDQD